MGFPLPEDPDVDDLLWVLVAIPNAVEFRRAAIGHLGELGKGQNWGEDAVTDASFVAAQSWLRAMQETYRLLDMGWPDLVLSYIDDIETLLQAMQGSGSVGCCPEGTTYYPPADFDFDSVPQPIVDAGFATSTSDFEGYADYRCMAAHMLLSNIQDKLDKLGPIILGGFALFNIVAGLLGGVLILGGGGATLVIAGLAVDIMAVLGVISALDDVTAEMVTGWADTLEDDRDTIVCAMQGADGAAAVKAALVAAVTDSIGAVGGTLVSFFNLDHLINAWWYGQNNGVDLAQQIADGGHDPAQWTCPCEADVFGTFTWDAGDQGWELPYANDGWDAGCQAIYVKHGTPDGLAEADFSVLAAIANTPFVAGHTYKWRRIAWDEGHGMSAVGPHQATVWIHTGAGLTSLGNFLTASAIACNQTTREPDVSALTSFTYPGGTTAAIRFGNPAGDGSYIIDNLTFEFDDVT